MAERDDTTFERDNHGPNSTGHRKFERARSQKQKRELKLDDLADLPSWVAWRQKQRQRRDGEGKPTKILYDPHTGRPARIPTEPSTWGTREEAEQRWRRLREGDDEVGGVGIVLGDLENGTHLMGIDLDSCFDNSNTIRPWALWIFKRFDTYTEISPSGLGIKLFFLVASADMPTIDALMAGKNRQTFAIGDHQEIAIDRNRFYAVTDVLYGAAMPLRTVGIEDEHGEPTGDQQNESRAKNGIHSPRVSNDRRGKRGGPRTRSRDVQVRRDERTRLPKSSLHTRCGAVLPGPR